MAASPASPVSSENSRECWRDTAGAPITCREKIRLLDESIQEWRQTSQDALDDALLMGCSESQFRAALEGALARLQPSVRERRR